MAVGGLPVRRWESTIEAWTMRRIFAGLREPTGHGSFSLYTHGTATTATKEYYVKYDCGGVLTQKCQGSICPEINDGWLTAFEWCANHCVQIVCSQQQISFAIFDPALPFGSHWGVGAVPSGRCSCILPSFQLEADGAWSKLFGALAATMCILQYDCASQIQ